MFRVDVFAAERPMLSARLLDNAQATKAQDCNLINGDLRPLEAPAALSTQPTLAADAQTLYLYNGLWFSFSEQVDVVPSPVRLDPWDRVYFTGLDVPRYTRNDIASGAGIMPATTFKLGVPAPEQPGVSYTAPATNEDLLDDETRYYLVTYVSRTGEESAPSPVSEQLVIQDPANDSVTLTLPTLAVNEFDIDRLNIYRTQTGGGDAEFFRIATVAYGTSSYEDAAGSTDDGVILATRGYLPPPADMHSLIKHSGGFVIGASGSTICPSEAYLPYAYKTDNQLVANAEIVAMSPLPSGAVVATKGYPELLTGYSPESLSLSRLELQQACVSKRSMVDMGQMAIYASPDGLVGVSVSSVGLLTEDVIEPEQWRLLQPETLHAYQHEGLYVAFYEGNGGGGFVFDPRRKDLVFLSFSASAGYRDLQSDKLYLVQDGVLNVWREGPPLTATWRSKEFRTAYDNLPLFRVKPRPGEVLVGTEVNIYTEAGKIHSEVLQTDDWGYIPSGLYESWQIELRSTATIEGLILAADFESIGL